MSRHGKQAAVELIVRVLACLAEGLGIRATARVFEVAPAPAGTRPATATAMYQAMAMLFWLPETKAMLAQVAGH
jgi:hypothetical protein